MPLFRKIKSFKTFLNSSDSRLRAIEERQYKLLERVEHIQEALGRVEARQLRASDSWDLKDHEYRVFSQWGEDGIIQFLIRNLAIENKIFVEFGVEDYAQSNTRFLLINDNWHGLVFDSNGENIAKIKNTALYSLYDLAAVHAFVTADNINQLLKENSVKGDIGLLSIDIDGNDFWVWRAIDVIRPVIVIIEYNHRFGPDAAVTVPYDESFNRWRSSQPLVYFGASLKALCLLAERKGYVFLGCNSNGVNAFFVRMDRKPKHFSPVSPEEGFVVGNFSELRDEHYKIIKSEPEVERRTVLNLPLIDVTSLD
ncbi:MAG TPA: FkbM family methyltransferase [Pyrinomonadaceae bacterium]|nr:FkbM family methyltransferase [Pyrinomonadaceae bacterium]